MGSGRRGSIVQLMVICEDCKAQTSHHQEIETLDDGGQRFFLVCGVCERRTESFTVTARGATLHQQLGKIRASIVAIRKMPRSKAMMAQLAALMDQYGEVQRELGEEITTPDQEARGRKQEGRQDACGPGGGSDKGNTGR